MQFHFDLRRHSSALAVLNRRISRVGWAREADELDSPPPPPIIAQSLRIMVVRSGLDCAIRWHGVVQGGAWPAERRGRRGR